MDGQVNFETDKLIQDFSYAGYKAGEESIPVLSGPVFNVTQSPYNADNTGTQDSTAAIQSAINAAKTAGGGVVFLPAGFYSIKPQGQNAYALLVNASNIVFRGEGVGKTFLLNTSTNMRSKSIILINGPSGAGFYSSGIASTAISRDILGPTMEIPVSSVSEFASGQWIVIHADCTDAWIAEHNESDWLGHGDQLQGIAYFRHIVSVSAAANTISINAPTRYYLKTRDNARVVRLGSAPLLECGLEDFSIGNVQHGGTGWGENDYTVSGTAAYDVHDSYAIRIVRARNCWVRNVATFLPSNNTTTCHLLSNGILLSECTQVTLTNCDFQRAQYGGGGGNGYMYRLGNSSDCLVDNCRSTFTRHGFVLSQMAATGNVFHDCIDKDSAHQAGDTGSQTTSGGNSDHHMHFSHANLVDDCTGDHSGWEARYRPYGSVPHHDLTSAHSVFWNTKGIGGGPSYVVQTEQSRYGYVIGTRGTRYGVSLSTYGGSKCNPVDYVEGIGQGDTLEPFSLYEDQLYRRLSFPHVSLPDYLELGFPTNSVRLQSSIQIGVSSAASNSFTAIWRVISSTGAIYFSNTNEPDPVVTFSDRGTNEIELTITANGYQASARETIFLAPDDSTVSEAIAPDADTFVRDGNYGNDNYGTATLLQLKKNSVAGYNRRAFLRFDLSRLAITNFDRAFLELNSPSPPAESASPELELHYVTNDMWIETSVTWNTQPVMGQVITNWLMSTNGIDRIEVSSIVRQEMSGDGRIGFGLLIGAPVSDTVYSFSSRESSASAKPELIFTLTNASPKFTDWIAGFQNLTTSSMFPGNDPDGDGLDNAEEYIFARDPTRADSIGAVSVSSDARGTTLFFPQRKRFPANVFYVIETTSHLSSPAWQPAPAVEFNKIADNGDAYLINAFIPANTDNQRFYRFRIVLGL
jgi:hypothetical protein